jgi:hypothetical protein
MLGHRRLTNSGERIAHQGIHNPAAAVTSGDKNRSIRLLVDLADDTRFVASGALESAQGSVDTLRRDNGKKLAFIRDVQRIKTQEFTGPAHGITDWDLFLLQMNGQPAVAC